MMLSLKMRRAPGSLSWFSAATANPQPQLPTTHWHRAIGGMTNNPTMYQVRMGEKLQGWDQHPELER
jgi:hypothetical protein